MAERQNTAEEHCSEGSNAKAWDLLRSYIRLVGADLDAYRVDKGVKIVKEILSKYFLICSDVIEYSTVEK
jgi:hypothetical protein